MATKPASTVEVWASNNLFTVGPYAGLDTKQTIPPATVADGFVPGSAFPSSAEHVNDWLNRASALLRWVYLGSSAGAADAHIVETDSDGATQLQYLTVSSTVPTTESLYVEAGAAPSNYAARIVGGVAFAAALRVEAANTIALEVSGGLNQYGLWSDPGYAEGGGIYAEASGSWTAGYFVGADAQYALRAHGTLEGQAIYGRAGPDLVGYAIIGDGYARSTGVRGLGGPSGGYGVEGLAQNEDYAGLVGYADPAGSVYGAGVVAVGQGDSMGLYAIAASGWSIVAGTTDGSKSPFVIGGMASDPVNTTDGQFAVNTTENAGGVANHVKICSGGWRGLWSSTNGYCHLVIVGADTSTSATAICCASTAFASSNRPKRVGKVRYTWTGEVGRTGTCQIQIQVVDVTAGVVVHNGIFNLYQSGAGVYERTEVCHGFYTLPAAGGRSFRVDVTKYGGGGADTVRVKNNLLEIQGVFD